jgi:hypothetical protein
MWIQSRRYYANHQYVLWSRKLLDSHFILGLANGPFSSIRQLKSVNGIGEKLYAQICERVYLGPKNMEGAIL